MNKFSNFDDLIKYLKNNNYGKEAMQSFLFSMYGVHLTNKNGTGFVSPEFKERLNDNEKVVKNTQNSPINIRFQGFGHRYNTYPISSIKNIGQV